MNPLRALAGYESDSEFIAAHHQPAVLIALALSSGVDEQALMRGVRLRLRDIETAQSLISPEQYLTLISNAQRCLGADDTGFLFGHRLLPGYYGAISQVLQQSRDLRQALDFFCEFHALLTPLMRPRYYTSEDHVFLHWNSSCAADGQLRFLLEANTTALVSVVNWLSGEQLPWTLHFDYACPQYEEQYWVHLGDDVLFQQPMNMAILPLNVMQKPWPQAAPLGIHGALEQARLQAHELGCQDSFVDQVYDHLLQHLQRPLNLQRVAEAFDLSPASLKRRLKKNATHFQAQLDLARKHTALRLHRQHGYNTSQIADYLRFNDMNNFRRAFKRWTGKTPGAALATAPCDYFDPARFNC